MDTLDSNRMQIHLLNLLSSGFLILIHVDRYLTGTIALLCYQCFKSQKLDLCQPPLLSANFIAYLIFYRVSKTTNNYKVYIFYTNNVVMYIIHSPFQCPLAGQHRHFPQPTLQFHTLFLHHFQKPSLGHQS